LFYVIISRLIHRYKACDTIKDDEGDPVVVSAIPRGNHPLSLMNYLFTNIILSVSASAKLLTAPQ
jgi:hypothetical protein